MKKLLPILFLSFCVNAHAQYTKLIDFADTTSGQYPDGSLMQASDGMLYGMTESGGTDTMGVLFQYNPVTNSYTKKIDFAGASNGRSPYGLLIQASDSMLYGMTVAGGVNDAGVLFQYNPTTNIYTKKFDFDGANGGGYPWGSLMQASDGNLYGMTIGGGTSSNGVLFQYNPTTNIYTKKLDFPGTSDPQGDLIEASDSMLYGMTFRGGTNNLGTLFQFNPITSMYTKKVDFDGINTGAFPKGTLMQASDGMLYGMTTTSGANNFGTLFQYNPTTNVFTKKFDFNGANGNYPHGYLVQATDGMLYGMTEYGGANNMGVLFQYDPATSIYTKKLDFAGATNGKAPYGSLMQANDGMLYGMTYVGGTNNMGVLFKYDIGTVGIEQFSNKSVVTIYPNPTSDQFFIEANTTDKLTVDLYDVNGRHVFSASVSDKSNINVTTLDNGFYTLTIKSTHRVINKKLAILR